MEFSQLCGMQEYLQIPLDILHRSLPSQSLSICSILAYKIPKPINNFLVNESFISDHIPDATVEDIKALLSAPAPPSLIIEDLLLCLGSISSPLAPSLACEEVQSAQVKFFPVWFLTYWSEISSVAAAKEVWSRAAQFLNGLWRGGTPETQALVEKAFSTLSKFPWHGSIQAFNEQHTIASLHVYTTKEWLGGDQENQMLTILQQDLDQHDDDAEHVQIKSTYFIPSIVRAFQRKKTARNGALQRLGHSLASGEISKLVTITHCQDVHWAPIVVDFRAKLVWHGDSLGWPMEKSHKTALEWWLAKYSTSKFTYHSLLITQQSDSHSCGLLAWNALSHFFLPTLHALIDPSDVASARLQVFLRVCAHQQSNGMTISDTHYTYVCQPSTLSLPEDPDNSDMHMATSSSDEEGTAEQQSSSASESSASTHDNSDSDTSGSDVEEMPASIPLDLIPPAEKRGKIRVESSLRLAIKKNNAPLLSFFKPCTRTEYEENLAREREKEDLEGERERLAVINKSAAEAKIIRRRELERKRQQKLRARKHDNEILLGIRDAGGRKRKVNLLNCAKKLTHAAFTGCAAGICTGQVLQETEDLCRREDAPETITHRSIQRETPESGQAEEAAQGESCHISQLVHTVVVEYH